jgi:cytoskeletal protein CcmA (bactofilin family)
MASTTFSGPVTSDNGFIGALTGNVTGNIAGTGKITHATTAAINATATATAAEVATGYITSTSAAGTTITLPTGTLLGAVHWCHTGHGV